MKKKISITVLSLVSIVTGLSGCGHEHTWNNSWSWNSTQHWVDATCEHAGKVCNFLGNHVDKNSDNICDVCGYNSKNPQPTPKPIPSPDIGTYYDSIDPNSSTLLSDLRTLNSSKKKRSAGYGSLPNLYLQTDIDPDGSGKIIGFYDNEKIGPYWDSGDTWNREHVWPNALGGDLVEDDAHMPRPTYTDSNSDRGCKFYAASNAYDPGELGYPNYRGIAARIIFYCCIAAPSLNLLDSTSGSGNVMGKLSDLLKWNLQYPPTASETAALELRVEQQRNNVIAQDRIQGNRNPFIDHPEYACKIWGTKSAATKQACGL